MVGPGLLLGGRGGRGAAVPGQSAVIRQRGQQLGHQRPRHPGQDRAVREYLTE